jgi:HK97 family phage portal protein
MPRPTWRSRLASWIGGESRSDPFLGHGAFSGLMGPTSLAGPAVGQRAALGIAAVWNAVTIYSNTIAGLDLYVARHDPRGGRRPAPEHPINPLVSIRPNPNTSSFSFRQTLMLHALTQGDGFAEIERDGKGRPVATHLMDPSNVEPRIDRDGALAYHLNDNGADLPARDVIHVHGLGWDGVRGYSPITLFRETLGLALAEREHQSALMGNSASPTGHFEMPGTMNPIQSQMFRETWNAVHQGSRNSGKIGIVSGGAKWVQTSFSPADSELLLSREFSIAEVARIFNMPQHMLGLLEHATFSNIEEQNIQFYQVSVMPWLRTIEQELNAKLFGPEDRGAFFATFDANSLLRGNLAAQTSWVKDMFGIGVLSRNEARMRFGLPPVEGGDSYYIPTNNLTPVGSDTDPAPSLDPDADDLVPPDPSLTD